MKSTELFNKCKTPKELYEAIEESKKVSRSLSGTGLKNNVRLGTNGFEYVPPASELYRVARNCLLKFRKSNPILSKLPNVESDPVIGLQSIQEWCISPSGGKVDLPSEKSGEIEPAPAKGSRVGNFLWKLYEKTLKVIVDAAFEKWGPK